MSRFLLRFDGMVLGGCLAALLSCATPEERAAPVADERLTLKSPTLVAFVPSSSAAEQRQDVEKAISETASCLEDGGIRVRTQFVEKEWMKVKDDDREIPLYPPFEGSIGVFLLLPGRAPRYVDAVAGTRTLRTSLPDAAAQYFSVAGCAPKPKTS